MQVLANKYTGSMHVLGITHDMYSGHTCLRSYTGRLACNYYVQSVGMYRGRGSGLTQVQYM